MKRSIKVYSLCLAVLCAVVAGCRETVPIKEMSLAKADMSRAISVKADKYAPAELQASKEKLFECHQQVKKEDLEKATKAAVESQKKAIEAYNKAVPLLAKDTIEIAEKSLQEADEAAAPLLAKPEYGVAEKLVKDAQDKFENKKYYEAYLGAVEADKEAKNARTIALGKKNVLKDSIDEVRSTLADAKRYDADKYAPEKVKLAEENLGIAQGALDDMKLKKGLSAVEVAKINADEAYLASLKETAKKRISAAELVVENANKSAGASGAKDELAGANESIKNAKGLFAEGKYKEAIDAADEAKRLAGIVVASKPAQDPDAAVGKDRPDADKDKDKIAEADKDYYIYKVKYRPSRRDCLWRIAAEAYKNPRLWRVIYDANRGKVKNPNLIRPGMKLKIPKNPKAVKAKGPEKTEAPAEEKAAE
ncbi:MAG TPA: LysM peptidoglycan-binding domain-containing protein [Spirochaetota bacterium]|nr:LysM peptidoglycan-binding domain-containing protein [Spirochaetota bacterium]HNT11280.1 LysM peptidoglycan-binding domain-containing protein [Spirochaetota bacterium]